MIAANIPPAMIKSFLVMVARLPLRGKKYCACDHAATKGARNAVHKSSFDAVDGSSTGTEVPWMWVLLRPPPFGGAKHASDHDNRSRHRQVDFSDPRS